MREHMGAVHARAGLVVAAFGVTSVFIVASVPASSAETAGSSVKPTVSLIKPTVCPQVPPPLRPVRGGYTGSIARVPTGGSFKVTASELPSGKLSVLPSLSNVVIGMADVHLYIGVQRSHGVPAGPAVVWQFNPRGNQLTVFAKDLTDMMGLTFGPNGTLVCS